MGSYSLLSSQNLTWGKTLLRYRTLKKSKKPNAAYWALKRIKTKTQVNHTHRTVTTQHTHLSESSSFSSSRSMKWFPPQPSWNSSYPSLPHHSPVHRPVMVIKEWVGKPHRNTTRSLLQFPTCPSSLTCPITHTHLQGIGLHALSLLVFPNLHAFAQAGLPLVLHGFKAQLTGVCPLHESLPDPSFSKFPKDRICTI